MAENIVKLRVDSKEYEAKIDRARQGLLHLEQELQKTGKNFGQASKEQVQYVQQLGQMGTVAQTVRGANLTDTRANTFAFLSMNRRFAQDIAPRHFSFDIKWHF